MRSHVSISRYLFVAFALLVSLASAPVRAQEEGRQLFEVGVAAYGRGNYAQALAAFEAAYAADRVPGVLYNIAMCQRALDRAAEAVNTFRRYLREDAGNIPADVAGEVRGTIEEMRPEFADLTILTDESGASVLIDDEAVGTTPLDDPVAVPPGEHTVLARLDDRSISRRVQVEGGERLSIELSLVEEPEPPQPPPTPPPEEPRLGWWFWTSLALAGAAAVGLSVTGGLALRSRSDYIDSQHLDLDAYDSAVALGQATDGLLGVAIGMGAVALVSLIVHLVQRRRSRGAAEPEAATEPGPGAEGVVP